MSKPKINWTWEGTSKQKSGKATYKIEAVEILSLDLPNFKTAHAIDLALNLAVQGAYHEGIRHTQVIINNAIRSME